MDSDVRTVVVTGGSSGIGAETARAFANTDHEVVIADIAEADAERTITSLPTDQGHFIQTDVSDEAAVRNLADGVEKEFGGADVLVNNAGQSQTPEPIAEQSTDEWQAIIDVHLRGTYLCSKYILPGMFARESGAVINLSSIAGLGAFPYRTGYGPAKAAINNLTQILAIEGAAHDVRVNAVAPGYVKTPLVEHGIQKGEIDQEPILKRTPMGRMAQPAEVAEAITFLASDRASYITGVVLPIDGGWTADNYV